MPEEKILTINLRRELLKTPRWKRGERAVATLKATLIRQLKAKEVKLDKEVNEAIWARGGKKPPTKLRLKIEKIGEGCFKARLMK